MSIEDYIGKSFYHKEMLGDNKYKIDSVNKSIVKVTWSLNNRIDSTYYPLEMVLNYIKEKTWIII